MREAVIVGAVRTALGGFNGTLAPVAATQLGALVIAAALERAGVPKEAVDEVIMGRCCPAATARTRPSRPPIRAGMPWEVAGVHRQQGLRLRPQGRDARRPGDPDRRRRRGGRRRHGEHERGPLLPREGPLRLPHGARVDPGPHGPRRPVGHRERLPHGHLQRPVLAKSTRSAARTRTATRPSPTAVPLRRSGRAGSRRDRAGAGPAAQG